MANLHFPDMVTIFPSHEFIVYQGGHVLRIIPYNQVKSARNKLNAIAAKRNYGSLTQNFNLPRSKIRSAGMIERKLPRFTEVGFKVVII